MKRTIFAVLSVIAGLVVGSAPMFAHHGLNISYDHSKPITLKGTVTEFRFANPHVQLYMDVKDETGHVVNWAVEGSGVFYWTKAGWNRNSVKPGDEVTVTLAPSKAGTPAGAMSKIVLPNGKAILREDGR